MKTAYDGFPAGVSREAGARSHTSGRSQVSPEPVPLGCHSSRAGQAGAYDLDGPLAVNHGTAEASSRAGRRRHLRKGLAAR